MKKIIVITLLVALGCKKSTDIPKQAAIGYNHTTAQGVLLSELAQESNRKLTITIFSYYDVSGNLIGSYNQIIPKNSFLLFDDNLTLNPNYTAISTTSGYVPIVNNTASDVHVDNGINYLYYQSNPAETATSSPSTVIKVLFTLFSDLKTLTLLFIDKTPGNTTEGNPITFQPVSFTYSKIIKQYTFVSI